MGEIYRKFDCTEGRARKLKKKHQIKKGNRTRPTFTLNSQTSQHDAETVRRLSQWD
jgi:hypothetical protein